MERAALHRRGDRVGDPCGPGLARKVEFEVSFTRESMVMVADATIEDRLAALEATVAELKGSPLTQRPAPDWLEQVIGSFKDEPAFEEVLAYGRAIRKGEPLPSPEDVGS